ncbi:MAG: hypothetical protein DRJ49_01150 [Thermoprotei archaeon]|nr:MAG: hypothetical protein DRN53_06390 [Thermoprotei archaeon]RLE90022.1 MAG: hypothetical protein DRJ49_01150 [Thermoprotei archaeon]
MVGHKYVPWRRVRGWTCIRCGTCCRSFLISLTPGEAMYYRIKYGPVVISLNGKYYLLPKYDGTCIFLHSIGSGLYSCLIYPERPRVCRIYPFYISEKPLRSSSSEEAIYEYNGEILHVYIDSICRGVNRSSNIRYVVRKAVELWDRMGRP